MTLTNSNPIVASKFDLKITGDFELVSLLGYQLTISTTDGTCAALCTQSNGKSVFNLTSGSFVYKLEGITNPSDIGTFSYLVVIASSDYISYQNNV